MYNRTAYIFSDSPLKKVLLKLFKKNDELIILDIGGCEGEDSVKYAKLFPQSSIFVFEPLPHNQQMILENIKNYKLNNIIMIPVAVTDESGMQEFYVSSGQPDNCEKDLDWDFGNKSSSLLPPDKHINIIPWLKFKEVINVPVIRLYDFLEEQHILTIDFIHLDVQGAELKVLQGAKDKIKNVKLIWLEVAEITLYKEQPIRKDIEKFMKNNNFCLIKSSMDGQFGDQLYLNKKYYNTLSIFNRFLQFHFKRKKDINILF